MIRSAPFISLVILIPSCGGTPAPAPSVSAGSTQAEPEPASSELPARSSSETAPSECAADRVWDEAAKACRLFPGGGYGWAGCSQAKAPPNGEQCATGTHWQECDCRCDAASTKWNATTKRCE